MAGNTNAASRDAEQLSEGEYRRLVNTAVADTEQEIFEEATGSDELENNGDTSLEQMGEGLEGDDLEDEDEAEEATDGEGETETAEAAAEAAEDADEDEEQPRGEDGRFTRQDEPRGHIPPARLREEAEARRQAEARERALVQQVEALTQQFQALQVGIMAPRPQVPPQQQQQPTKPDMFADPDGYERWMLERSERIAEEKFQRGMQAVAAQQQQQFQMAIDQNLAAHANGPRSFEFQAAYRSLTSMDPRDPAAQSTVRRILNSPDQGEALFQWWDANGGQEFRENLIAQLQGRDPQAQRQSAQSPQSRQAPQNRQPRHEIRGPVRLPSLNGAAGSNSQRTQDPSMLDNSDSSVFDYATRR